MLAISSYFRRRKTGKAEGKSHYHDVVLGLTNGMAVPDLLRLCILLGLRDRAVALADSYQGEICSLDMLRLALLRGDFSLAGAVVRTQLKRSKPKAEWANEIATLVAPVDSVLVHELACMYPRKIICAAAVRQQTGHEIDWPVGLFPKSARLGPDGLLLECNSRTEKLSKLEIFNRYLSYFGLSGYSAPLFDYSYPDNCKFYGVNSTSAVRRDVGGPLVTVIITVNNCAPYVRCAIVSLLNQTYKSIEILVIDDASTDGTAEIVEQDFADNPKVRVIRLARNVGTYRAKNIGLSEAKGEYVAFQDGDDWSHPQRIETSVRELNKNTNLVFVSHLYVRISQEGNFYSPRVWPLTRWTPNSVLFRRTALNAFDLKFDSVRFGGDSEFAGRLKVIFGESAHVKIRKPLMFALHRPNSLMSASATGLDKNGYSRLRVDYQQEWSERLVDYAARDLGLKL